MTLKLPKIFKRKSKKSLSNFVLKNDINREYDTKSWHILSYRELRIIGWIAMCFTSISAVLFAFTDPETSTGELYYNLGNAATYIATLAIPCFLVANYSIIFRKPKDFKRLLVTYGSLCLLMIVINYFFLYRYIIALVNTADKSGDLSKGFAALTDLLNASPALGTFLNMFVDMFMCVLFYFFFNFKPSKGFQGKKIFIFRSLSAIPFIYEFASLTFRLLTINPAYKIDGWVFPLLCTKPPYMFLSFVLICIYMKEREKRFFKKGGTQEEYEKYLNSDENFSDFNTVVGMTFLATVVLDYIFFGLMVSAVGASIGNYWVAYKRVSKIGIGSSMGMILMCPIMSIYSYKKEVPKTTWEPLLPLIGIILYVLMAVETAVDIITLG